MLDWGKLFIISVLQGIVTLLFFLQRVVFDSVIMISQNWICYFQAAGDAQIKDLRSDKNASLKGFFNVFFYFF